MTNPIEFKITITTESTQPQPQPKLPTPTITPLGGEFNVAQIISITCNENESLIYYTTDGNTPTSSSTLYNDVITLNNTTTLKAISIKEGFQNSDVATQTYNINIPSPEVEGYIYVAGGNTTENVIKKYSLPEFKLESTSNSYGYESVWKMIAHEGFIYTCGPGKVISKYSQNDLSLVSTSDPVDVSFSDILIIGEFIYAANNSINKFKIDDLSFVSKSDELVPIHCMTHYGDYIYVGDNNDYGVRKYRISDLREVGTSNWGSDVWDICVHDEYIYHTSGRSICRIGLSNMLRDDTYFINYHDNKSIQSFIINNGYIYMAGDNNIIRKFNLSTKKWICDSPSYGNWIQDLAIMGNYIYATGYNGDSTNIKKYNISDLSFVNESDNYLEGGYSYCLATVPV